MHLFLNTNNKPVLKHNDTSKCMIIGNIYCTSKTSKLRK